MRVVQSEVRLNAFLARAGLGSRRAVESLIVAGRVRINGERVKNPAHRVVPGQDEVIVDGNPVYLTSVPTYIALHKPRGYITTAHDEKGRKTVFSLIRSPVRIFPVGRLDRDSEGLLLLTNDGELANRLMHPRYKVAKTYLVQVNRPVEPNVVEKFRSGVVIGGMYRVRGEVAFPRPRERKICRVTISEGRNRQIRKMFAAFQIRVTALIRLEIGPLKLGRLPAGEWRYLTKSEVLALKKMVRMADGDSR